MGEMIAELRRLKRSTDGSKEELQTRLRGLGAEKLQDFRERTMAARAEKQKKAGPQKQKAAKKKAAPKSISERKVLDKKSKQARERRKQKRDKATQAKTRQY